MRSDCFESMALTVTEEWIRERVKLNHNNLEDVRSLSLPGTYHEKISCLGDSLRNFSRIKTLDLSRNAIESLQGLESLKMLEKLTLYYNNIPNLQELYRLRYNQRLQELDLRLNSVARNEPDYRLFLIHMLPNLRRLDDRAVRDSERKAALMHFNTDQATEMTAHAPRPLTPEPKVNPRVEHVKSLAKPPTAVDQDEAVLMEYSGKTTAELLGPRQISGSRSVKPAAEEYTPQAARQMDRGLSEEGYYAHTTQHNSVPYTMPQHNLYNQPVSLPAGPHTGPKPAHPSSTNSPFPGTATDEWDSRPSNGTANVQQGYRSTQGTAETEPGSVLPPQVAEDLQKRYPNLMGPTMLLGPEDSTSQQYGYELQIPKKAGREILQGCLVGQLELRKELLGADPVTSEDANLKYQDEIEAYTSYKAQGHFTPHPDLRQQTEPSGGSEPQSQEQSASYESPQTGAAAELYTAQTLPQPQVPKLSPQQPEGATEDKYPESDEPPTGEFGKFLCSISDLVDKYWNGSKSLLKNPRFKHHMNGLYQNLGQGQPISSGTPSEDVARLREELQTARDENTRLRERTLVMMGSDTGVTAEEGKEKGSLIRAQRDVSILRSRLQKSMEENKALEERIMGLASGQGEPGQASSMKGRTSTGNNTTLADLDGIQGENESLRNDITSLKIRLKQASQMQELAAMLQESHKSLVQSNDHLLRELDETRQRHAAEVKQLHWSYDQLKKSVAGAQPYGQPSHTKAYNGTT